MPAVLQACPSATLRVVGDGVEGSSNAQLARELGIDAQTVFVGEADHATVAAELRRADVLVFPSRTMPSGEAEGHPVVLKEAYATGTLVVATESGGTREVVPPDSRGELVTESNPSELADAITRVLRRPDEWRERALRARDWVSVHYDSRVLARRVAALYERMTGDQSARLPET
jgi:glycosyltransferase involved in cell wall biosynthesis